MMRSLGLPELLIALIVIVVFVWIFKSSRKREKQEEEISATKSFRSGSGGYVRKHLGNCPGCGADLDTNDPHQPGCRRGGG